MEQRVRSQFNELIDQFCEALALRLDKRARDPDLEIWPAPLCGPVEGHFVKSQHFWPLWRKILTNYAPNTKEDYVSIARIIKYPTRIARSLYLLPGLKEFDWPVEERINLAGSLLYCLTLLRSDAFCTSGHNFLLDSSQILEFVHTDKPFLIDLIAASTLPKTIGRLCASLFLWCELNFLVDRALAHEIHGPYLTENGQYLIVREYHHLRPWFSEAARQLLAFDSIRLNTYYATDIGMAFDFMGALGTSTDLNWLENLNQVSIRINEDNQLIEHEEVEQLTSEIDEAIEKLWELTSRFSRCDFMIRYTQIGFDIIRPFFDESFINEAQNLAVRRTNDIWCNNGPGSPFNQIKHLSSRERIEWLKGYYDPRNNRKHSSLVS